MKNLLALNYKENGKVFFDFKDILKEIELKDVIKYFNENNISIKMNNYAYVEVNDGKLNISNLKGIQRLLYMKVDKEKNIEKTELFERDLSYLKKERNFSNTNLDSFVNALYSEAVVACIYSYYLLKKLAYPNMKKSKELKVIKCKNHIKITDKVTGVESKFYKETNENYTYELSSSNVKILDNGLTKKEVIIPSKLYPLSNPGKIAVFTENNTEELNNASLNKILTGEMFKSGYCYSNADRIIELIKESNLDCKAEFYSGWIVRGGHLIHHGWVVIDDKYILDPSVFKKEIEIKKIDCKQELGLIDDTSHEEICNMLADMIKDNIDFKDKYVFGKVLKGYIYVGVKSDSLKARVSFNKLLDEVPNHPEYLNIDRKTGYNKTLKSIHSKL